MQGEGEGATLLSHRGTLTKYKWGFEMAKVESISKPVAFERFDWAREEVRSNSVTVQGDIYASLASDAIDVGSGICSVLALLEACSIAEADGDLPVINKADAFSLIRLAQYSARKLSEGGTHGLQWAYEHRTEVGRQEYGHARREAA